MRIKIRTSSGPRGATYYNGKSIHDLARELQCAPSHVSRVLNTRASGGFRFIVRLAVALGVGVDDLILFRATRPAATTPAPIQEDPDGKTRG